jgi:hypothetical protein
MSSGVKATRQKRYTNPGFRDFLAKQLSFNLKLSVNTISHFADNFKNPNMMIPQVCSKIVLFVSCPRNFIF